MTMEEDSTWKEMERRISKSGYREGADAGHKSTFQTGFDEGFQEGARFGQMLGYRQGQQAASDSSSELLLESNCQICEDSTLLDGDYSKLKETQVMANTAIEANIKLNISDTKRS